MLLSMLGYGCCCQWYDMDVVVDSVPCQIGTSRRKLRLSEYCVCPCASLTVRKMNATVRLAIAGVSLGWLGASGNAELKSDSSSIVAEIEFDCFWASREASSRPQSNATLLSSIGRIFFIKSISIFPVVFVSDSICVFEFPPLGAKIGAAKQT